MASSLTYQFRQQQVVMTDKHDGMTSTTNLPSPPNSSYGEENTLFISPPCTMTPPDDDDIGQQQPEQRRDSLQSHFSTLTLQAISNSLPENYTIDHSSIKASLQQALATTLAIKTAAAAAKATTTTTPIPIERLSSPTSVAAGTGGLTIRHRRPSTISERKQPHQHRFSSSSPIQSSTSLPSTTSGLQHRCIDCGKVYKHSSCLVKHRWEHSEEWELTSKLPLTKHQQVQMLEAAAILVSMDHSKNHTLMEQQEDDEVVDILNDDDDDDDDDTMVTLDDDDGMDQDDDDDESIQVDDDDDDDDISIEMDQDDDQTLQQHTFPSMIGSTPAMLPTSFSTNVV